MQDAVHGPIPWSTIVHFRANISLQESVRLFHKFGLSLIGSDSPIPPLLIFMRNIAAGYISTDAVRLHYHPASAAKEAADSARIQLI